MKEKFIIRKLFQDPTPKGIVNNRIIKTFFELCDATDLSDTEKREFLEKVLSFGRELIEVWKHYTKYCEIEDLLIQNVKEINPDDEVIEICPSQELFSEFKKFLNHFKTALDYLVKIPTPILGIKKWNFSTYKDEGDALVKGLRRNLSKEQLELGENIASFILRNKEWIKQIVDARDRANHGINGGINFENFTILKYKDKSINLPMWFIDQTIREFLQVVWRKLFFFSEDFIAAFLTFRLKPGLGLSDNQHDFETDGSGRIIISAIKN